MRISKQQLRRIIKEEKVRLLKESFSADAIHRLDKTINYNKKQAASVMAPEEIEMYEDDAASLEMIRDMAIEQKASGAPMASGGLSELMSSLDTIVREQIPQEIYYWIIGQEDY